jgi:hypothetical protein
VDGENCRARSFLENDRRTFFLTPMAAAAAGIRCAAARAPIIASPPHSRELDIPRPPSLLPFSAALISLQLEQNHRHRISDARRTPAHPRRGKLRCLRITAACARLSDRRTPNTPPSS